MYKVTQKLPFYTFLAFERCHTLLAFQTMQQINNFLVSRKNETKTQIKRSKIKLLYLLAPSLFLLNRAKCSACADKFPTCLSNLQPRSQGFKGKALGTRLSFVRIFMVDCNEITLISGIDKMRERASAARRHLLNFCRHILKY